MRPGFYRLPLELIREIAAESSSRDLAALALTARHFHGWVNPCLYERNIKHERADAAVWAAVHGRLDTLILLQQAETQSSNSFIHKTWRGRARYGQLLRIQPHQSPLEFTLLHLAARGGNDDVVSWLLQQGAVVDAYSTLLCECDGAPRSRPSWTPLHYAICHSQEKSAKILLANNSLRMNKWGTIHPLHNAASKGLSSTIRHLSTLPNFDPDVRDSRGRVSLHHAINVPKGLDVIQALIEVGADLQNAGVDGSYCPSTPLMSAIAQGDLEAAVMLFHAGAKPFPHTDTNRKVAPYRQQLRHRQRHSGLSLLAHISGKGDTAGNSRRHGVLQRKVIRALLGFGCDVNDMIGSVHKETPLIAAVRNSSSATVHLLLERGAKVNATLKGFSPLWYALSERTSASMAERADKVTALLERGADLLNQDVIRALVILRRPKALLDAVADNLGPENLADTDRIPVALGLCRIFQERKLYDSIKRYAQAQARATDEDIQYALQEAAGTKRVCVPTTLDEMRPFLDEMRPGLTVDGVLDQWRDVMLDNVVEWLEEMRGRESSN